MGSTMVLAVSPVTSLPLRNHRPISFPYCGVADGRALLVSAIFPLPLYLIVGPRVGRLARLAHGLSGPSGFGLFRVLVSFYFYSFS
jgi:hypothetical protein